MNVRLRLMTIKDIPEGMRLKEIAGWNQTAVDWQRFLSASPGGCFAAECQGRVVGTSTTIVYEGRFAWIGMVLVDPDHRGQGLGTLLLQRAMQYLDSRGVRCIKLDATPQGQLLYQKFGFVSEYEVERWMLTREGDEKAVEETAIEIDDLLQLDRGIFGADRSGLLRSLTEEAPDFTLVARQEAGIVGYTFGRRGALADHLGPWMAGTEDVAAELLDEFLHRCGRELAFVDCVRRNPWAVPLVKDRGFTFSRPLTRMFRGTNHYEGRPELLCAILGPEFG